MNLSHCKKKRNAFINDITLTEDSEGSLEMSQYVLNLKDLPAKFVFDRYGDFTAA